MALANTRSVSLSVHLPHTEFNDININNESKIKLLPSQIQEKSPQPKVDEDQFDDDSSGETSTLDIDESTAESSVQLPETEGSPLNKEQKPRKKYNINPDKRRAEKFNKLNVAATGILTTIPVTGARPRPTKHSSLEDEVLFTIFQILFDHDAPGKGMTVKQICDVLLEKHPEMAKLLTKTSNLVSAKLNAYVKRVEKGEENLNYALSREWADTLPKRMVYVYRGILTKDYYVHAKAAMKNLEENFDEKPDDTQKTDTDVKRRSLNDFSLKAGSFGNSSQDSRIDLRLTPISIPYDTENHGAKTAKTQSDASDETASECDFDTFDDFEEDEPKKRSATSKSQNKRAKTITAAAAAPRVPKMTSNSPLPSIVMAAAASLRAAALHALTPPEKQDLLVSSTRWLQTVREGFLTQDIGTPEDISLAELDSLFR